MTTERKKNPFADLVGVNVTPRKVNPFSGLPGVVDRPPLVSESVTAPQPLAPREELPQEEDLGMGEGFTLKPDGSVWSEDFKFASVGKLDPETREFIPAPWVEPAGVLSDILRNAPWSKSGRAQLAMERYPELVVPERGKKPVTLPPEYDGLPEEVRETARQQLQFRETEKARGGRIEGLTEEYEALPWLQQLKYELPFWTALAALPAARVIRSALAPFTQAGKPIVQRVAAEAGRVVLAPLAGAEVAIATGLKYGVGLPLKLAGKGIEATIRKAFETALDAGLDKWLVRQGIRAENAPRIIEAFMKINKAWLYRTAQDNLKKRMAQKMGVNKATQAAAEDTVKQAETRLLTASKTVADVPAKPPVTAPEAIRPPTGAVTPEIRPTVPQVIPRPIMKDPLVSSAYDNVMAKLPREIVDDLDNIVKIDYGGAGEGVGGHVDVLRGKNVQIFLEKGLSKSETETNLRHEILHAYLIKHPEIRTAREGYFGEENAIRAIEKQIKATGTPTAPIEPVVKPPPPKKPVVEPLDRRIEIQRLLDEPAKDLPKGVTKIELRKELKQVSVKLIPQEKALRQKIMAEVKEKGLAESQYREIFRTAGGKRYLREVTLERLSRVLDTVKTTRPIKIKGRRVVTQKTEQVLVDRKAELIEDGVLTKETYDNILSKLRLKTDKYVNKTLFITQTEANSVIKEINNVAILAPLGELKFGKPTPVKFLTSDIYYGQVLGVHPLVEPLELAKVDFDLAFRAMSNAVTKQVNKANRFFKGAKGVKGSSQLRDLLDKSEEPPVDLTKQQKEAFNWFRNLNRTIINGENEVRRALGMPEITYREAYVRHIPDAMASEILRGIHPLPPTLEYWAKKIVSKKIFNPMEFHRKLSDDLAELYTKDLEQATRNMVYTGLKEIHLASPLKSFTERMGALSDVMPAPTKKWVVDFVNQRIKGQQTEWDEGLNSLVADSGFGGLVNDVLKPYRLSLGTQPVTQLAQLIGRMTILSVLALPRPRVARLLIRNVFQRGQDLAFHNPQSILRSFLPDTKELKALKGKSRFLSGYTGVEEFPAELMAQIEKVALAPYQFTAVLNADRSMSINYYDYLPFFTKERHKGLGWASPKRTYKEPKGFLYPEEQELILAEMELGARATQYQYLGLAMPGIFRNKTLIPLTRLQSWWMNYIFMFNREAAHRLLYGTTRLGHKLPWTKRLHYLTYLLAGGAMLTSMGYGMSYLWKVLPHNMSPAIQLMMGLLAYVTADSDWKREEGKKQIYGSWKAMVPGALAKDEFEKLWSGEMPLWQMFFYGREEEGPPPRPPTWGIINRQPALDRKAAIKDIGDAEANLGQSVPKEMPDPYPYIDPATGEYLTYTYPAGDYISRTTDLGSTIRRATQYIPDEDITEENGFSPLAVFYKESEALWEHYYYSLPESQRLDYRKTGEGAYVEAVLYFWGKLTVLRGGGLPVVKEFMRKYNIPNEAIPAIKKRDSGTTKPITQPRVAPVPDGMETFDVNPFKR